MTSLPPSAPGPRDEPEDDLVGFRPSTARVLAGVRGWLLVLVAGLVLVPVGARVVGDDGPGYVQRIEPARLVLAVEADHGASGSPVVDAGGAVVGQLYARLEAEECCVALPIADVVAAARDAAPAAVCP